RGPIATARQTGDQPNEVLGSRHEQRRRDAFARVIPDEKAQISVGTLKEIVEIAAHLARRLHHGEDFDRPLFAGGGEIVGPHSHLQFRCRFEFLFHSREMSPHLVAQSLFFQACANPRSEQNRIKRLGREFSAPSTMHFTTLAISLSAEIMTTGILCRRPSLFSCSSTWYPSSFGIMTSRRTRSNSCFCNSSSASSPFSATA